MRFKICHWLLAMPVVVVAMLFASSRGESAAPHPQSTEAVSTETATPTLYSVAPAVVAAETPSATTRLDMDAIFPPAPERDRVLFTCTACHSFVRIVLGQRTVQRWEVVKSHHRLRLPTMDEADLNALFAYLEVNFNETKPIPELPTWLLEADDW